MTDDVPGGPDLTFPPKVPSSAAMESDGISPTGQGVGRCLTGARSTTKRGGGIVRSRRLFCTPIDESIEELKVMNRLLSDKEVPPGGRAPVGGTGGENSEAA